ncbi:MAG: hypothetical protein HGA38_05620 [Candidatus Moranbacteria bacterium]|nr:hypothetical protein [Candidatus Moranbacteria bacterium]
MEEGVRSEKTIVRTIISLYAIALLIGGLRGPLFANAEDAYTLEPFYKEIRLKDVGQSESFMVSIVNHTEQDTTFRVVLADFGTLDESGGTVLLGGTDEFSKRYGLASWMRSDRDLFTVPAGEREDVSITVENRESLPPGGHYGAVRFEVVSDGADSGESRVSIRSSFAALVFAVKEGGEVRRMTYSSMETVSSDAYSLPEKVSVRFRSDGNTHLVPRGTVSVIDPIGRVVREGTINPESGRILPESFRIFPTRLRPVGRAILPGPYTVRVSYRYDGKDDFTAVERTLLPWKVITFFGIGIGLSLAVLLRVILARFGRKSRK